MTQLIHHTAIISREAQLGRNVSVGPFSVIEGGVIVGDNVSIAAHCHIGIEPFDFRTRGDGSKVRKKSKLRVVIQNGVEIGSNVFIQKGTSQDTLISRFVTINNSVNIGHDVEIGEGTNIGFNCSVSGYTKIGMFSDLSPGVVVSNRVTLGNYCQVGIGSLVLHNYSDHQQILGHPAEDIVKYKSQRRAIKEKILGEYKPNRVASSRNNLTRLLKRFVRRVL
ncbi:MAG: hypothetical protein VW058_01620 [Flavobacteriaceae bacterium]